MVQQEDYLVSYTMLSGFKNCRKYTYWKYVKGLYPFNSNNKSFGYGTNLHKCLELWYSTRDLGEVEKYLREKYKEGDGAYHNAKEMFEGYIRKYGDDVDWELAHPEVEFKQGIEDPETGTIVPGVKIYGRVDGVVKKDGKYWLLESKTATNPNVDYFNRLWTDYQITLYTHFIEKEKGIEIEGVIYNVLCKANEQKTSGETEEEYLKRKREKESKNKSGKTTIKRKEVESTEDFVKRLKGVYHDGMYVRQEIIINKEFKKMVISEVAELVKCFLNCVKRDKFYMNTDNCFKYNKCCEYYPICKSGCNENVIREFYKVSDRRKALPMLDDIGDML